MSKVTGVVGIDPSLTSTGVVRFDLEDNRYEAWVIGTPSTFGQDYERYRFSMGELRYCIRPGDVVFIEDYAFGIPTTGKGRRSSIVTLAELGGLLRMTCFSVAKQWPFPVSIGTLKKFITGRGTKVKYEDIKLHLYKKYRVEFQTSDECVAYGLAQFGLCALQCTPFLHNMNITEDWLGYELQSAQVNFYKSLDKKGRLEELHTCAKKI